MKPDLLILWPRHLDYPNWRKYLSENRFRFAKVIIIFTNMSYQLPDLRNSVKASMEKDNVIFEDNDYVGGKDDWRNIGTNKALKYSDAEWVFFTEQDFFPKEAFWECVEELAVRGRAIGIMVGKRLHPCCLFVPRKILDKTSKDFSVIPDVADHFIKIQQELPYYLIIPDNLYTHESGLSQKMTQELLI